MPVLMRILEPARGDVDRAPHGGRDRHHLLRRHAKVRDRRAGLLCLRAAPGISPGPRSSASTCSSGWRSSAPPTACAPASTSASTSSSTCWASSAGASVILFGLLCGALFTGVVGSLGAYFVMAYRGRPDKSSDDLESADVDRLPVRAARLLPDVLPLPAGGLALRPDRRAAATTTRSRRRASDEIEAGRRCRPRPPRNPPEADQPPSADRVEPHRCC